MTDFAAKKPLEDTQAHFVFDLDLYLPWHMRTIIIRSFILAALVVLLGWPAPFDLVLAHPNEAAGTPPNSAGFQEFLQSLWPLAQKSGVTRTTFDMAIADLEPDTGLPAVSNQQAEFDKPLKAYLSEAVSIRRIARGRDCRHEWHAELTNIEQRFGVPAAIIVAAYGMETDFGTAKGGKDVIRSLATLAYSRRDRPVFRDELISALVMLDKNGIARAVMKGSWAGAMGGPQFLPSAFLKYAVSFAGAGSPDIWNNPLDSLASIANFLRQSGWQPGLPWGMEVILPKNFGYGSLHQSFAAFAAEGVKSADGGGFPQGEATLFLPSGAAGPGFLLSANYWVLKAYNNSDSYALSLAHLADRIKGEPALHGDWPEREVFLSRTQKAEIQRLLEKFGLYHGDIDGRFGQASRDAIHDFQLSVKTWPADGFATPELLDQLAEAARRKPGQ
jgi:lytic murein transglycosylase